MNKMFFIVLFTILFFSPTISGQTPFDTTAIIRQAKLLTIPKHQNQNNEKEWMKSTFQKYYETIQIDGSRFFYIWVYPLADGPQGCRKLVVYDSDERFFYQLCGYLTPDVYSFAKKVSSSEEGLLVITQMLGTPKQIEIAEVVECLLNAAKKRNRKRWGKFECIYDCEYAKLIVH